MVLRYPLFALALDIHSHLCQELSVIHTIEDEITNNNNKGPTKMRSHPTRSALLACAALHGDVGSVELSQTSQGSLTHSPAPTDTTTAIYHYNSSIAINHACCRARRELPC
jgi:hypothetical protein